jgi:putative restriction endonuclease
MQNYENYWSITNAFTDYNGTKFIGVLRVCIEFIDQYRHEVYTDEKYERLQSAIQAEQDINLISIRKAINQLVKFGFINAFLLSYPSESKDYLNAKTNKKRALLLSKIVYSNSSLNRAVSENSSLHQINFLIQTLIEIGALNREDIIALMLVDIATISKGYLTRSELDVYVLQAKNNNFISRKYNQIGYLINLLKKLEDIVFVDDSLYFTEDVKDIIAAQDASKGKRDNYLHRLYKNQLKEEVNANWGAVKCMLEELAYPVLIASHIKPFIQSKPEEAYDVDNGLLLSKNMDSLFDLGYITFNDDGTIVFAQQLAHDVQKVVKNYQLNSIFLNTKRKNYLDYHRKNVFEKRYKTM